MRLRAADVLWMKLLSSENHAQQDGIKKIAEKVASFNSENFSAFFSEPSLGGDPTDSFIKRILWPSKPVIHVAMALHATLRDLNLNNQSIMELVMIADKWLIYNLFLAEIIRVEFGCLFPRHDSQYLKQRERNFSVDLDRSYALTNDVDLEY